MTVEFFKVREVIDKSKLLLLLTTETETEN